MHHITSGFRYSPSEAVSLGRASQLAEPSRATAQKRKRSPAGSRAHRLEDPSSAGGALRGQSSSPAERATPGGPARSGPVRGSVAATYLVALQGRAHQDHGAHGRYHVVGRRVLCLRRERRALQTATRLGDGRILHKNGSF